jgi:methionyl-tRNA formyltransferase
MKVKHLRVVFMGTPDFAVTILEGILKIEVNVVGVVTAVDKPAGRGQKIAQSSVKKYAEEKGLNILQPINLKDTSFQNALKALKADLFVVVAFRMLPENVWSIPPMGTINLHASLLPQYRGAAPINWAIINGEKETGVTTFFIEKEIDTGKIILSEKQIITDVMNAGELHDKLAILGVKVVNQTLCQLAGQDYVLIDQGKFEIETLKKAPKIFKEDCRINKEWPASKVYDFIRGMSPYPGAYILLEKNGVIFQCKIYESKRTDINIKSREELALSENGILYPCADKYLNVTELQLEGKKRMTASVFKLGNKISDYKIL